MSEAPAGAPPTVQQGPSGARPHVSDTRTPPASTPMTRARGRRETEAASLEEPGFGAGGD